MSTDTIDNTMEVHPEDVIPDPSTATQPPAQPQYVTDLTQMLNYMNDSQAVFQKAMADFVDAQRIASTTAAIPRSHGTIKVKEPRVFNGRHEEVKPFLSEVEDCIWLQRQAFLTDKDKALYMGRYLKDGSPNEWFSNIKQYRPILLDKFPDFVASFKSHFADPNIQATAMRKLDALKQTGSAHAYINKFYEISAHLDMTEQTKIDRLYRGLSSRIKDELVSVTNRPKTLVGWEPIIIRIDQNLQERDHEKKASSNHSHSQFNHHTSTHTVTTSNSNADVVPMDVDAIRTGTGKLSTQERENRIKNNLCLYCGKSGHMVDVCTIRKAKHGEWKPAGKATPKST